MKQWTLEFVDYIGYNYDSDGLPVREKIYEAKTAWAALRLFKQEYPMYEVESIRPAELNIFVD